MAQVLEQRRQQRRVALPFLTRWRWQQLPKQMERCQGSVVVGHIHQVGRCLRRGEVGLFSSELPEADQMCFALQAQGGVGTDEESCADPVSAAIMSKADVT